jgi:hypothetical protein
VRRNYFEEFPTFPAICGLAIQRGGNPHLPLPFIYGSTKYSHFAHVMDEEKVRARLEKAA